MRYYYVYIMASGRNGTLYVGMTNDLQRRMIEHKAGTTKGFTQKYNVTRLVYYEMYTNIDDAIIRETRLKNWKRDWKLQLIEEKNINWKDLAPVDN